MKHSVNATVTHLAGNSAPPGRLLTCLVDLVALAAMIALAGQALGPAYGGHRWLVAVVVGAVLGAAIGGAAALLRWSPWMTIPVAAVAYLLVGPAAATPDSAIAGTLPSVESTRLLAVGVVTGWRQMLTVAEPIGVSGGLLIPAFLAPLVLGVVACSLAGRLHRPLWALACPAAMLVVAALLGSLTESHPVLVGAAVALLAVLWGSWRAGGFGSMGVDIHRPISLGIVLIAAVGMAVFAAPLAAPGSQRTAVRDIIKPLFDPQQYVSPLSGFRNYVKALDKTDLFTVTGLPADARIRLATMDAYNGQFYNVGTTAGEFTRVGDVVRTDAEGSPASVTVTIDGYSDVWLPDVGSLAGIKFVGARAAELASDFRYSTATGTGAVIGGLEKGDSYRLATIVAPKPDEAQLKKLAPGAAPTKPTGPVPSVIASAASTLSEGAGSPYEKVEAIRNALATRGLLSHGDTRPSASGHGYDRLLKLLNGKDIVGDAEQFAPAMALMVQSLGIPARVVMGFAPKGATPEKSMTVHGSDITAWVEVEFDKVGWVAFDPNPDESNKEQDPQPKAKVAARQQAMQPPPPPRAPEDADTSDVDESNKDKKDDDKKDDKKKQDDSAGEGVNWFLAAGVGVPSLLVVVPIGAILLLKTRRRRRRRGDPEPSRRMAGGWDQLIDGAIDLGTALPGAATRREAAGVIDERFGGDTAQLARTADSGVFAPDAADEETATRYWADVDGALKHLGGQVSIWRRLRAKLSLASLRGRRTA